MTPPAPGTATAEAQIATGERPKQRQRAMQPTFIAANRLRYDHRHRTRKLSAMLQATILDDRGKRVPLVPHEPGVLLDQKSERVRRLRAAWNLPRERPARREIMRGVLWGLAALPVLLAAPIAPVWFAFNMRWPWWGTTLATLPMALLPALVTVFITRRLGAKRIARCYRHADLCASCGYDLIAAVPDAAGFIVCPECGAAWFARSAAAETRA